MKRRSFLAAFACSFLLICASGTISSAIAKDKKKGHVVGTIWSYELKHNGETKKGQFRMYEHEIFKGPKKIGDGMGEDKDEAKLIITDYPPLNGTAVLRKTRTKPPLWKGTLVKNNGATWMMEANVKEK